MKDQLTAIGLMSGTSMDGIDAALIVTDGKAQIELGQSHFQAYGDDMRSLIAEAVLAARSMEKRNDRPDPLQDLEQALTKAHAQAIRDLLALAGLEASEIDVIGFHGHTILHAPERRLTVQLGDGARLAELTGLDVVNDFRESDVAGGGEGAPLVPVFHQALMGKKTKTLVSKAQAVLNIGGVANITWMGADGSLLAFDTGPGNALIDDWVHLHAGLAYDDSGKIAARGKADEEILRQMMKNDYFARKPPKSLDRDAFSLKSLAGLSLEDGAATLTSFTAQTIAKALEHCPAVPESFVVCGGGRKNQSLMRILSSKLVGDVIPAEDMGFDGDFIEAQAFGYLAVRALQDLPLTFPQTTGVSAPQTGGIFHKAISG